MVLPVQWYIDVKNWLNKCRITFCHSDVVDLQNGCNGCDRMKCTAMSLALNCTASNLMGLKLCKPRLQFFPNTNEQHLMYNAHPVYLAITPDHILSLTEYTRLWWIQWGSWHGMMVSSSFDHLFIFSVCYKSSCLCCWNAGFSNLYQLPQY